MEHIDKFMFQTHLNDLARTLSAGRGCDLQRVDGAAEVEGSIVK
jgi:hypothetical protein